MHRLKDKVAAIVTDSSNIIKPIALRFGDEGANVVARPGVMRFANTPLHKLRSRVARPSYIRRKSLSGPTARTSTDAPLLMCLSLMIRTPITRWSKTAGAGGIGSMRLLTRNWSS